MKTPKVFYFLLVLLCMVILVASLYVIHMPWCTACESKIFTISNQENVTPVEFWIGFSGVLLSFISIVMVIMTLVSQLYQLKLQKVSLDQVAESNNENFQIAQSDYNAYVLQLVEKFLGPEMTTCREVCWLLREDLKHDKSKLDEIKKLFVMQISDDWGTREEYAALQKTQVFVDYANFTKLIRFFDMMSHYKITEETAYAIHFYYVWWRSFFVEMINCFNQAFLDTEESKRHMSFPPDWCSLITRMDSQMNKLGLSIE